MKSRVLATSSAIALGLAAAGAFAGQAFAQEEEEAADAQERIVVTGSRIVRQDFTANSPIVTVDTEQFENTTSLTVEGVLNQLPQFMPDARSEFRTTSVEPTPDQTPGTAQVNLRGLGANRSLVLIDGRRAMPVNANMTVDVNAIPATAIQRVEIISGGASAVYGADAVGGVVNFILRDNYEGVNISARYGMTERGDAENTQISGLFGADFDNGRGNVMFGADLSNRGNAVYADRDWMIEQMDNPNLINPGGFLASAVNLTNYLGTQRPVGIPDRGNTVPSGNQPQQYAVDALFPGAIACDTNGAAAGGVPTTCPDGSVARNQTFYINTDPNGLGTLFSSNPIAAANILASGGAGAYKYNGPTRLDGYGDCPFRDALADGSIVEYACYQEVSSPLDRYSFFGRGRYEVNESLTLTLRGQYATTSTRSVLNPAAASFIVPVGNQIWTGNAYSAHSFRNPTLRTVANPTGAILSYNATTGAPVYDPASATHPDYLPGGRYGVNCAPTGGCTQSQVFPLPPELVSLLASRPFPNEDIQLNTFLTWGDVRGSSTQTDVYQIEAGAEGDLSNLFPWAADWYWDVGVSHGETHILNLFDGFGSQERFRAIVGSPNFGRGFAAVGNPAFGGTGGGNASCTSGLPIIRDFAPSEDCILAYETVMQNSSYLEQNTLEANLTGDLFDLPAGPVQFAAGLAYREDGFKFQTDTVNDLANFADQPLGLFPKSSSSGYISVSELYGELLVPVVQDLPLVRSLTLELGGRISDYDPSGQVETYKALGDWEITDFARLRGGWNRATRAPNLQELYSARQQTVAFGFGTLVGDPCSLRNEFSVSTANPNLRTTGPQAGTPFNVNGPAGAAHAQAVCRLLMERDSLNAGLGLTGAEGYTTFYDSRPASDHATLGNWTSVVAGNENVQPETADTYTLGLVLTSPFPENPILSGFTGSVDWYQIEIVDLIAITDTTFLVNDCLGLTENPTMDITRFSCSQLIRDPLDGDGLFMDRTYTNQGRALLSGVDLQVNWRGEFADVGLSAVPGGVSANIVATFPVEQITQTSETSPEVDAVGTQYAALGVGGGAYEYDLLTTLNYFVGDFNATLSWQYSPSIESAQYATDPNTTVRGVLKGASLFNLSGSYRLNETVQLRAGIDNVLDTEPPLSGGDPGNARFPVEPTRGIGGFGGSGVGAGAYDALGRRYFAGITLTF